MRQATATTTETLRRFGELYAIKAQLGGQPPDLRDEIRKQAPRVERLTTCDSPMVAKIVMTSRIQRGKPVRLFIFQTCCVYSSAL